MAGVIVGLRDLYFAVLTKDDNTGSVYGTPKPLAAAISATITPNTSSATLYANDVAVASSNSMGAVEVELEIDQLKANVVNELLGVEKNADGVLEYNDQINAPYVALLFKSPLSGGGFRYVALTKGMFNVPEDSYQTKGESVEFQTKTITGNFVTREFDKVWKYEIDDNDATDPTIIENWFDAVYNSTPIA